MILIIEDDAEWLMMLEGLNALVATDASAGLDLLSAKPVSRVLCDFHGIQKNGKTAHDIVRSCLERGIPCVLTTNDVLTQREFEEKYGIACVTKMEMVLTAQSAVAS